MARKITTKSKNVIGAKAAMAEHSNDKATKSMAARKSASKDKAATSTVKARKSAAPAKSLSAKIARKSAVRRVVGGAVDAVTSTVSGVAESAASLFKGGKRSKKAT